MNRSRRIFTATLVAVALSASLALAAEPPKPAEPAEPGGHTGHGRTELLTSGLPGLAGATMPVR